MHTPVPWTLSSIEPDKLIGPGVQPTLGVLPKSVWADDGTFDDHGAGNFLMEPKQWRLYGLPIPEAEYRFHPERRWRFDYAFPSQKIGVEIEGGVWNRGRHTRAVGFIGDMEKYNEAGRLGWRVFRFTPQQFNKGEAFALLRKVLS